MSYDIFNELATDSNLEENGAWFSIGKGARLLVARSGNRKFSKLLNKLVESNKEVLEQEDDAAGNKSDELMTQVLASTILLGWEGISFKGVDTPFSVEQAAVFLALKDFRMKVTGFANQFDAYKVKQEVTQGNV